MNSIISLNPGLVFGFDLWQKGIHIHNSHSFIILGWPLVKMKITVFNICCWISIAVSIITQRLEGEREQVLALHFHHLGSMEQTGNFPCKDGKSCINNFISTYWIKHKKLVGMKIKWKYLLISLDSRVIMTWLACSSRGSGVNDGLDLVTHLIQ